MTEAATQKYVDRMKIPTRLFDAIMRAKEGEGFSKKCQTVRWLLHKGAQATGYLDDGAGDDPAPFVLRMVDEHGDPCH